MPTPENNAHTATTCPQRTQCAHNAHTCTHRPRCGQCQHTHAPYTMRAMSTIVHHAHTACNGYTWHAPYPCVQRQHPLSIPMVHVCALRGVKRTVPRGIPIITSASSPHGTHDPGRAEMLQHDNQRRVADGTARPSRTTRTAIPRQCSTCATPATMTTPYTMVSMMQNNATSMLDAASNPDIDSLPERAPTRTRHNHR